MFSNVNSMDSEWELNLISLISELFSRHTSEDSDSKAVSVMLFGISLVSSMDLESHPKPESKLMSLIKQTISVFNSIDLDSHPKPLSELISFIKVADYTDPELISLVGQVLRLEPEPELISLVYQIFSLVSNNWGQLISVSIQGEVELREGKFHVTKKVLESSNKKGACLPSNREKFCLGEGEDDTHYICRGCNGKYHEEHDKTLVGIKHVLHSRHSLQLVLNTGFWKTTRKCYCCDEDLKDIFYYCTACDFAVNIACVEKQLVLALEVPKWHKHTLALFPRKASLTCDLCALADSSCPFYICPPCDFVVHQRCIRLPRVIRISRHLHRISFCPSFDKGDWSCAICRRKIDNDYGGYSCIKDDCSYAAHSRCATQNNVWDGIELEGAPEETKEEVEPFVRISEGVIQHFSHQQHHMTLDENTCRVYEDNKLCQACVTPIYFSNFYSCMTCDFILHEKCANLSRNIYHPIHPHILTLVGGYDGFVENIEDSCSACPWMCKSGFFYECDKEECSGFKLHVQCATISEPLVHGSHMHPLFLTSKPEDPRRTCPVCKRYSKETFNCTDGECKFFVCFGCATMPQEVRYKHDKHILTLCYGEETSSTMAYWCEACESKIDSKGRFYKCDEYCCVTLHIDCMIGESLYMKPGSSFLCMGDKVDVLPNSQHMSRPICFNCDKHCPRRTIFQRSELIFCSYECVGVGY